MCYANKEGGMHINLHNLNSTDMVKMLFAENPGVIIQVPDAHKEELKTYCKEAGKK